MPTAEQAYQLPRGRDARYVDVRLKKKRGEQVDPSIVLTKGHVSKEPTLGEYYIDFVPSFSNYSEYRYGVFDEEGVPLVGWGTDAYYNPITIAQYGLLLHSLHSRALCPDALQTLHALLEWFERNKETSGEACFWRQYTRTRYGLPPGFISAMASGEALSFYLRMYQLNGDAEVLERAKAIYAFLRVPYESGGVRRLDANGDLWFEEYPTNPPSYVLNGFIYCVFGLYDLLRVSGDPDVAQDVAAAIRTLRRNLYRYDAGYWSFYDQLRRELVSVYYQRNVHVPQMEVLYELTGDEVFRHHAEKWRRNLNPATRLLALLMMRVRARIYPVLKWLYESLT